MAKRVLITEFSLGIGFDSTIVLAEAGWDVFATHGQTGDGLANRLQPSR